VKKKVPARNQRSKPKRLKPLSEASQDKIVTSPVTGTMTYIDTNTHSVSLVARSGYLSSYVIFVYNVNLNARFQRMLRTNAKVDVKAGEALGTVKDVSSQCQSFIHVSVKEKGTVEPVCEPPCDVSSAECYQPSFLGLDAGKPKCKAKTVCNQASDELL